MEDIRSFVYSILVVSASGAVITMFAPDNHGVSKYLHFLVSIVVTSVLLFPVCSSLGKLPEIVKYDIEFDVTNADATVYTETVAEQACKNIGEELSKRLYERFDLRPTNVKVSSNGDAEQLKIEQISVYYNKENSLLFSDTVNYVKDIFGDECEVMIMYEDTES